MSKIHYFQRYSSPENTVTNNTLQLLARIYDYSATTASKMLTDLTGEPIDIGIEITQQQRIGSSVPDGSIIQRSFKILIEAKVDAGVDVDQLVRHASTFGTEAQKVLLLLTRHEIGPLANDVKDRIHASYPDVFFRAITYEHVVQTVRPLFKEHEVTMKALVDDFIEYCNDSRLFDIRPYLMRIVPCGSSIGINKKYGIYFQPSDRGYTPHSFVGIYANKSVQALIPVESVFDVMLEDDGLHKTLVSGADTDRFDHDIRDIIAAAADECGYDILKDHRFFCGPVIETDFRKSSPGGIQGARFVDLREFVANTSDPEAVARDLRGTTWA